MYCDQHNKSYLLTYLLTYLGVKSMYSDGNKIKLPVVKPGPQFQPTVRQHATFMSGISRNRGPKTVL